MVLVGRGQFWWIGVMVWVDRGHGFGGRGSRF